MKRILKLKKDFSGQWQYSIVDETGKSVVAWQYGSFDREDTITQARQRFAFTEVAA